MLKLVRRFKSTLVRSDLPANLTKVASKQQSLYELQGYQNASLQEYFKEDALLIPVETIIQKSQQRDYQFFLSQGNFLKVVDTFEKFEQGMLDKNSPAARDFVLFKRELYQVYQVQNRSVHEHELFSFQIQRGHLKWLSQANESFLAEVERQNALEQMADFFSLKGAVFKRRLLSPLRLKGLGAFAATAYIYSYLPYIAVYLGSTVPVVAACAAGLYCVAAFSDNRVINEIRVIDQGDHQGKLLIQIAESPFVQSSIIVDPRHLQSVVSFSGSEYTDEGTVVNITRHINEKTGVEVTQDIQLQLPGDNFQDRMYMDWLLSEKSEEGDLSSDYHDLLHQRSLKLAEKSQIGIQGLLKAKANFRSPIAEEFALEQQLKGEDPKVDEALRNLQEAYGKEYLASISDRELFALYKKHSI